MNNMRNKILSLLVLLLTAASGAWAGVTPVSVAGNWLNPQWDATTNQMAYKDGVYSITFSNMPAGQNYEFKFALNNSWDVSYGYSSTTAVELNKTLEIATQSGVDTNIKFDLAEACDVTISFNLTEPRTFMISTSGLVIGEDDKAPIDVTLNEAKTEASFEMPTYDVDVDYELVRDMAIRMPVTVGDGNDGYRIRLKKSEQNPDKFEPAETDVAGMIAMIKVHDAIENQDLMFFSPGGSVDCTVSIYAIDDNDQPVGNPVAFQDLVPGRYIAKATAATGSTYDGETANSNIFVLFLGYPVEVPAGEFATFYKDEPLYADPISSADAELYTISSISGDQAVLSSAIETAPSNTPLLVYNNSDEAKTFLLIPADAEPNLSLDVYDGFIGTLTATTIAASDEDQTNYAFNGKAFVYVKYAIPVAANKAWLNISNSNARVINIVFDETTGVNAVERGTLTGDIYDLNGRKLQNMPTKKGIYILNGKKVVVK